MGSLIHTIIKVTFQTKILQDHDKTLTGSNELLTHWKDLLKVNLKDRNLVLSSFYNSERKFQSKLYEDQFYKLTIVFDDPEIKNHIGKSILHFNSDTFTLGEIKFVLDGVTIENFSLERYTVSDNITLKETSAFINFKSPVLLHEGNTLLLMDCIQKLNLQILIEFLCIRLENFNLSIGDVFPDYLKIINKYLLIDSFYTIGKIYNGPMGIKGWIKVKLDEEIDLFRQLFYLIDFFGIGTGYEVGFGIVQVTGIKYK